jgi:N-acyl-D-amino-acid deacylase
MIFLNYTLIIKNGRILDGTGNPCYSSDIGIKDGFIKKIGIVTGDATRIIDASKLVVCPGFIDIHSHSDFAIPFDTRLESTIRQGITTIVTGNCGESLAPINPDKIEIFRKLLSMFVPPGETLNITWESFQEYLEELEKGGCSTNIVPLVGFGTIRIAGGPGFEERPPNEEEFDQMKELVDEAMRAGAVGLSSGLIYSPQVYAKTDEIIELTKIVAKYDGLYFSHIRNEGSMVIQAVEELIEIVEKSGCLKGGQIAHHKASGPANWGKSIQTLKLISEANERGLNVSCDQYPYNRGMTSLITVLPPWVHIGGVESILERLQNYKDRERIKKDINEGIEGWENWFKGLGADKIYIASVKTESWQDITGKSLAEITKIKDKRDDFETLFDLILEEKGEVAITIEGMDEKDICRIMSGKYTMIGTDGWGVAPTGPLSHGKPHPRFYGTYPRILGKYVREEGVLTLETAIRKMTSFPAQKLGLNDRGLIWKGMCADIVVFDPSSVIDQATYTNPHQFPIGIKHVLVNGDIVVENEHQTPILSGKVLKHTT